MRQVVAALLDELDRLLRRPRSCEASRWRARPRNEVLEEAVGLIWKLVADDEASTPSISVRSPLLLTTRRATVIRRIISALFTRYRIFPQQLFYRFSLLHFVAVPTSCGHPDFLSLYFDRKCGYLSPLLSDLFC